MKLSKYISIALILLLSVNLSAQSKSDTIIFKALKDEMSRNLSGLKLENQKPPFFIQTSLADGKYFFAKASLGALIRSREVPLNNSNYRLMVGDYAINDENFVSGLQNYNSGGASLSLPIDNDYLAIRRAFWLILDRSYKVSIDNYTQKLSVLKQQNKDKSEIIDDYSRTQPVTALFPYSETKYDKTLWENNIKKISAVFENFPQIQSSAVDVFIFNANIYTINSEGSKIRSSVKTACILVNASTQAVDGELLNDQVLCYAPLSDGLPSVDEISAKVKQMAENLDKRRSTPIIEEAYQGPVVFEGDALADLFNNRLFGNNGLLTSREPLYANVTAKGMNNKIENKIGKRLCAENISIASEPKTKVFNNTPLVGSYDIDADGVVPQNGLMLVDKGILKTLLSDRVPTPKIKESNGSVRFNLLGTRLKSPGVINVTYSNGQTYADLLKSVALETAKNGLEYYYIVRKFETSNIIQSFQPSASGFTKPVAIYKVSVKTGNEELVRCANLSEFPLLSFKYALGGTTEKVAYNMVSNTVLPISYIVPKAMAFNDISLEKDNSPKGKLPILENPLAKANK
jgi:hypothetical protein